MKSEQVATEKVKPLTIEEIIRLTPIKQTKGFLKTLTCTHRYETGNQEIDSGQPVAIEGMLYNLKISWGVARITFFNGNTEKFEIIYLLGFKESKQLKRLLNNIAGSHVQAIIKLNTYTGKYQLKDIGSIKVR